MKKGAGTRSGLLWEVERILEECNGELPHVLLMENVPQVIGKNNIKDFWEWRKKLEDLGYSNYVQILNAKDYGIPQNRQRCFMVSILGNWSYEFPKKIPLDKKMKDILENEVEEKYLISPEKIMSLQKQSLRDHKPTFLDPDTQTITQGCGNNTSKIIVYGTLRPEKKIQQRCRVLDPEGISPAILATDYKEPTKIVLKGKENTKDE